MEVIDAGACDSITKPFQEKKIQDESSRATQIHFFDFES